jgi:hypothetical protein
MKRLAGKECRDAGRAAVNFAPLDRQLERVGLPIQLNLDQSNCASLQPMS